MKKQTLLLPLLLGFALGGAAQYPCLNNISTNPANPVNTQLPSKRNTFFDWQLPTYNVQPINNGSCVRGSTMESPFFKIDNLESLRDSKDMNWSDGWELIRRGFGLNELNQNTTDPVPNAYFILYNKYTGVLRVLLKVCRGADYNAAKITIRFDGLSPIKTDLLDFSRGMISALDKSYTATAFSAGSPYVNDDTKWYFADFPMMFDPCTCAYKSKLNIISELISTSTINLYGTITGDIYTKDVGGKAQIQKPGSIGWKDISGFVKGKLSDVHGSVNSFLTESKNFASNIGMIDTVNKKSALDNLGNFLKDNQFLKAGLNAVPWLKTAVSLFDMFIGGGKTTAPMAPVKLHPLTVNLTARLEGTLTTVNQYHDIKFTNPGSKDAQLDPDVYPYYNEILGVFNLIKSPVAFKYPYSTLCETPQRAYGMVSRNKYRFELDSLKYVLNPAAGVTVEEMKAAIVIKARPKVGAVDTTNLANAIANTDFPALEGKDAITNDYRFRTEYFDIKCLDTKVFDHKHFGGLSCPVLYQFPGLSNWSINSDSLFIKFMIRLKKVNSSATTQDVLLVLSYPLKLVVNTTTLFNNVSPAACDALVPPQASSTEVNTFCNSTAYNNIKRQTSARALAEAEAGTAITGARLYPNPSNGQFTVNISPQSQNLRRIYLTDLQGRVIDNIYEGNLQLSAGYSKQAQYKLPAGMYLVTVITTKGRSTLKLIMQ